MAKLRVLSVSNSHPDLYVGGAEVYSYELYQGMRASGEFEPILLARSTSPAHRFRREACFHSINDDPNQVLWFQENHDHFFMTSPDKTQYTEHFHNFLTAYRPQVVHVQHTVGLGLDLIRQIKNSLPDVPIVYTLHEFLPICHAQGHMLRTQGRGLCNRASPLRCHECFLDVPPQIFFLRERLVKAQLRLVDLFIAPSRFLRQRYVEWGIPADKIRFLENGRILPAAGNGDGGEDPPPGRIGFFGQLASSKGLLLLLKAMKILRDGDCLNVHLTLNGANLEHEREDFRSEVESLLRQCDNVKLQGKYHPAELPERMREIAWVVVPSIWWENSPMVIQEAFMHRRPVLCSNVGGMAEKVEDGVNGLHFRLGDSADLAETLERAATSPELWRHLRAGIPEVFTMAQAVAEHGSIYRSLLAKDTRA